MRPVLSPAARRLWRDPQTLQLGRSGPRATVLTGLDPAARGALALFDGSRDERQLYAEAASGGCPPQRTARLLYLLRAAGLLQDSAATAPWQGLAQDERERLGVEVGSLALLRGDDGQPALADRRRAAVLILGAGRVGSVLAGLLATAGIGALDVVDDGPVRPEDTGAGPLTLADVGRPRGVAVCERVADSAPSVLVGPLTTPDLVVLAPARSDRLAADRAQVPFGCPHLLVEVRDTVGVVGPLVVPGRGPCLRCLDLTRADLDPGWPAIAAQLTTTSRALHPCDAALALLVAGQAALQVLSLVDGTCPPATIGGTLELSLPDWRTRRRSWPVHPDCGCTT